MAGGLAALLDDVAVIAKLASSASTKAMGVVIDDAAVTPRYVTGLSPARELPIIWRIAKGSLRNKAIILVVALALSQFLPWLLTPILMLGGTYLCFEGAEKVWEAVSGQHGDAKPAVDRSPEGEDALVRGAVTTDFILSAEIMVISLNQLSDQRFWYRAVALVIVGIFITALVYGVVALIVKMDDVGLRMREGTGAGKAVGSFLVAAMPRLLTTLSAVGIAAMLWVGGHIILDGAAKLGWGAPLHLVHGIAHATAGVPVVGGGLEWLTETFLSAILGLLIGGVIVAVLHLIPKRSGH
ncbi:MAG: DUF808 domain-containing protein [Propionibacteriaceae bacterium]|nr:DUF808 domain-containing protein [Propionibacteriaceae bacterium]